jgi:hypothetical protein
LRFVAWKGDGKGRADADFGNHGDVTAVTETDVFDEAEPESSSAGDA